MKKKIVTLAVAAAALVGGSTPAFASYDLRNPHSHNQFCSVTKPQSWYPMGIFTLPCFLGDMFG